MFKIVIACLMGVVALIGDSESAQASQEVLNEMIEQVSRNHMDRLDRDAIAQGLLGFANEYLKTIDPHSRYLTKEEYQRHQKIKKEGYIGIGINIVRQHSHALVIPLTNGPAFNAGIKTPKYLWGVNGESVRQVSLENIARRVRGSSQSSILLNISDSLEGPRRDLSVKREPFIPPSVEVFKEQNSSYIRINKFVAKETAAHLKVAIMELSKADHPIVLDLRHCSGGDFFEALDAVSLFLEEQIVSMTVDASGKTTEHRSLSNKKIVVDRVVLLVGPHTGSSAEVFAGALQFYVQATLVGQRTRGKCSAQAYYELSDGSALKLTVKKILYPDGRFCGGEGLAPDVSVTDAVLYDTKRIVSNGIEQAKQQLIVLCLSEPFHDRSTLLIAAKEIEVAMNLQNMKLTQLTKSSSKGESQLLCVGPIGHDPNAKHLKETFTAGLGKEFHWVGIKWNQGTPVRQ